MDPLELFPYEFRFNQKRVVEKIYMLAESGSTIFFHAPTGYGKTIVVLSALIPLAEEWEVPIIWSVRTGNETDRPIEELKAIYEAKGENVQGISIRGKRDMCILAREKKIMDSEGVSVLCNKMKNKCKYFENLGYHYTYLDSPKTFSELLEYAFEKRICPYYYQLRLASDATVVSVSYNYVFSDKIRWALKAYVDLKDAILVVDEAHNLQHVMASINSDKITIGTVERAINELKEFRTHKAIELLEKVRKLRDILIREGREILGEDDVFDPEEIVSRAGITDEDFDTAARIVSKIYARKLSEGKSPRSSLRHLFSFLDTALRSVRKRGVAFIKFREKDQYAFEVWDMRASEILRSVWRMFSAKVFMSGTLKPFKAFAEITGIRRYRSITGAFPIPSDRVLPIVLKGLTTKGEELPEEMITRYVDALGRIIDRIDANTAVFFASYRIMEDIAPRLLDRINGHKDVFMEKEGMRGERAKRIIETMRERKNIVLMANMSGRFAEGVDLPGEALEAIILVGIPFERLTIRTTIYIEYYKELYGPEKGTFYSYVLPALRRASQAMGRAIRSPKDRAVIIAADERYYEKRFLELLPEFFRKNAKKVYLREALEMITRFEERKLSS